MARLTRIASVAALVIAAVVAQEESTPALPNWIGPKVGRPIDTACYRRTYRTKSCPPGYEFDKVATCWAQCPIEYPVECGMECIPQNADCTTEVFQKISAVAKVAFNAATSGVFGELTKAHKGISRGVMCGKELYEIVQKIAQSVNQIQSSNVDSTFDQLHALVSKSDIVVIELPVAVANCLGVPVPDDLKKAPQVFEVVKRIVDGVIDSVKAGMGDHRKTTTLVNITSNAGIPAVADLKPDEIDTLKQLVHAGATCVAKVKTVIDKVVEVVKEFKKQNPSSTTDMIRFAVSHSSILLKDLPEATVMCVNTNAPDGFKTRDQILKTVHVIIDRIVDASSQNGNPVSRADYAIAVANMGLDAISLFDASGLATLAKEYVQPICGPTAFVGEIDDGPADQALGLQTIQKAFRGSTGTWTKSGDGMVKITFQSVDIYDVTVNIKSGGDLFEKVTIKKGQSAIWTRSIADLQDKTLYLDRWRPGFLGIPGTGGGSLLLWVPRSSDGGHLELMAKLNPTSFGDKL
ncbi:TPA: hypothetical protein N0F65_009979 [Lagenidium giganteum]|uniref:Uncharacterized protein n=1 Tax=Lagenidium giganteum TaxID=4803 RepID=A0AAV2ZHW9_9STRA|nr:TPA: hypothetical protein N0F65_009979 [Lagenidium giganteum]